MEFTKADYLKMIGQMGKVRDEYMFESLQEASAFINFINTGKTEEDWIELSPGDRSAFRVKNPDDFLRQSDFCVDEFLPENGWSSDPEWASLPALYLAFMKRIIAVDPERDSFLHKAIEEVVLRNYASVAINPDDRCHIGHILHGLVAIARSHSRTWSREILILDLSDYKRTRLLNILQDGATLMLCIVCSSTHWALAALQSGINGVVIYDGQHNHIVYQKIVAWSREALHPNGVNVTVVDTPQQKDDITCGHRVLLAAEYIIRQTSGNPAMSLPLALPEDFASRKNLQRLATLVDVRNPAMKREIKQEQSKPIPPVKRLKSETMEFVDTPPRRTDSKKRTARADSPKAPVEA